MTWNRLVSISLVVALTSLTSGCAVPATSKGLSVHVQVPLSRPAIDPGTLTPEFKDWLKSLVEAHEANCTTLHVINGESPKGAAKRCEIQ